MLNRHTGRTTEQLSWCNEGDYFIVPTAAMISYIKTLPTYKPRVKIYTVSDVIDGRGYMFRGIEGKTIVFDHAIDDHLSCAELDKLYNIIITVILPSRNTFFW